MNGFVDASGRALLAIAISASEDTPPQNVDCWIDTGFTGELVVPQAMVNSLGLTKSGSVDAVLADGSAILLNTYSCIVNWFGTQRHLEVIANEGQQPLLGVGLLLGLELKINYRTLRVSLTESPA